MCPERFMEPRRGPERPRDAHICPVNRLGDPYTKPPGELNTYS